MNLEEIFNQPAEERTFTREEIFVPLLKQIIEQENNPDPEPSEEAVFRASGLGYCGRATLYKLLGLPEGKTYGEVLTLEFGTQIHEIVQKYVKMLDGVFISMEDEIRVDGVENVSGHYDGLVEINGKRYLIEFKSSNVEAYQRLIQRPIPYDAHKKQSTFYMKALGVDEVIFVYINKNGKLLADFEKANPDAPPVFLEIRYKFDEELYNEIISKVEDLTNHFKNGTMPEYKRVSQCSWCSFSAQCAIDRKKESAERRAKAKAEKLK